ncbi:MAG TPA: lasso peptide [Candidatus Acidoferrum sp.]|jgi:hypothetical protein|nr:lasso peptide [Candidatus Acidoferrum sp.]
MKRSSEKLEKKKPYQSPKLLVYGNLTEMTQAVGRKHRSDGGKTGTLRFTGR